MVTDVQLQGMLSVDAAQRCMMEKVLSHEWLAIYYQRYAVNGASDNKSYTHNSARGKRKISDHISVRRVTVSSMDPQH